MRRISEFYRSESEESVLWADLDAIQKGVWISGVIHGVDYLRNESVTEKEIDFLQKMEAGVSIRRHAHEDYGEIFTTISGVHIDRASGVVIPAGKSIKFRAGTPHEIENITPEGGVSMATVKFYKI